MRLVLLVLLASTRVWSQDVSREIWDTGFLQKRPVKADHSQPAKAAGSSYRLKAGGGDQAAFSEAALGFTVWRLRPPALQDRDAARLLIQDGPASSGTELVPERLDPEATLHVGDRIRLSIEVPSRGYLYVIDRERYRDGKTGEPYLIVPTLNQNGGDNAVTPGRLIEIPSREAKYKALRITRNKENDIGEDLMVVVSPTPLDTIVATEGQQRLAPEMVQSWDREWGTATLKLDLVNSPQISWSPAEQKAGDTMRNYMLDQADPLPATIFGIVPNRADKPILIHIPLVVSLE